MCSWLSASRLEGSLVRSTVKTARDLKLLEGTIRYRADSNMLSLRRGKYICIYIYTIIYKYTYSIYLYSIKYTVCVPCIQACLNDISKCVYVSSDHISELSIVYRYIGDLYHLKRPICAEAIHENATPARELWYWYWFDRLQECLSNSHLQVSYRTTTCRQCNRASPIDIGTLQKENPQTNAASNNHGKIVNIMFFPFNGLILWQYYCWWYTNLDLVGTNRRFFRTTITCPRWFPVVPRDSRNFSRDMRASTSGLGK